MEAITEAEEHILSSKDSGAALAPAGNKTSLCEDLYRGIRAKQLNSLPEKLKAINWSANRISPPDCMAIDLIASEMVS